ncbi:MAG: HEAT repeat domain-containing protein [Scytonema sp. RU_4_4]|nr:HEAT repeat domain-containing protein [Scytonema sp. RU_4_4]
MAGLALVQGYFPKRDRSLSLAQNVALLAGRINKVSSDDSDEEAAVTENWQEALRLCVASCNDDYVDEVLQAILKPLEGEDAETTARPRAVMATLCLVDEPNVSEGVAREVLQEFVRQVGESDTNEKSETSVQTAVVGLAVSRWVDMLRSYLLKEYQKRDGFSRLISYAVLYAVTMLAPILDIEEMHDQWFLEQVSKPDLSEEQSIGAALFIIYLANEKKISGVPVEMIDRLLKMLTGSAPATLIAALALDALNQEQQEANAWRPQLGEIEQLISFIKNPKSDSLAIMCICLVLSREGNREAAEPLIFWLDDSDKDVRQAVAWALGKIKDTRAVQPLIAMLDDSNENVRRMVAFALGKIGDKAVQPLIAKLDDSNENVLCAVTLALIQIGDKAVEPLIAKLDDSSENVRYAVEVALVQLGHTQTITVLFERLSADDQETRIMALKILSHTCKDKVDRKLLSRDIDAFDPFLDPQEEIDEERVRYAAERLKISVEEVRSRYQALAQQFPLKLNFAGDSENADGIE